MSARYAPVLRQLSDFNATISESPPVITSLFSPWLFWFFIPIASLMSPLQ